MSKTKSSLRLHNNGLERDAAVSDQRFTAYLSLDVWCVLCSAIPSQVLNELLALRLQLGPGEAVEVTLDKQANVRLLDELNFTSVGKARWHQSILAAPERRGHDRGQLPAR